MVIVAVLNAGRNAFSFFLLLIVCMGYGVVKHSLGRTMIYVRILAIGHFVFAVVYSVASLSITPDSAGPLVLLIVLPLAGTLTAFYVWTLNSLNATMKDLIDRKQKTKAMMYKKLWWCILGSIIVIFGFFFINSFAFAGTSDASFVPEHWKARWFVLDGWLNLVYLFDIAFVAYLWRPTVNNRRFAMSDEVWSSLLNSQRQNQRTNISYSLLKTTMDLRSDHSAVVWMKKMLMMLPRIILAAQPPRAVISPQFLPSPSPQHPVIVSHSTKRQYSQSVKRMLRGGPMMKSRLVIQARDRDSPAKTRIRLKIDSSFFLFQLLVLVGVRSNQDQTSAKWMGLSFHSMYNLSLGQGCKHVMALVFPSHLCQILSSP